MHDYFEAYSASPHMTGLCKLRKTKLDDIFFLFLHVDVDEFSQRLNKLLFRSKEK